MKEWKAVEAGEGVAACFAHALAEGPTVLRLDAAGRAGGTYHRTPGAEADNLGAGTGGRTPGAATTIVVGVRDSADRLVAEAGLRARARGATVVIVHACERPPDVDRQRLDADLAGAVSALRRAGVQAGYEMRPGRPAAVLADVARETGADLVVIGSPRPKWGRRRIGAVGRALGRDAPCSVVLAAG